MKVHHTALKHGIEGDDALRAAQNPVYLSDLDEGEAAGLGSADLDWLDAAETVDRP